METKTLKTIQVIAKIGKILSKIGFVLSIVAASGCFFGMICLAITGAIPYKFGDITLYSFIQDNAGASMASLYCSLIVGFLMCGGQIAIAKVSELYFRNELEAGTPFTTEGAEQMKRLGIVILAVTLGTYIVSIIGISIVEVVSKETDINKEFDVGSEVFSGIVFLIMSLLCKLGAESKKK